MASVFDVARYFLTKADPDVGDMISHLKLQKLCYYGQAFHLAIYGTPLFHDEIEAWTHGPVIPSLYAVYRNFGSDPIPAPVGFDPMDLDSRTRELLDDVYSVYGQYSAWKLRNMTHEEPPWKDAADNGKVISQSAMKEYFQTLVR